MKATEWFDGRISGEFEGAELGDERRTERVKWLAEGLMTAPGVGFPKLARTPSELEGIYRFFRNEHFDAEDVLEPHVEATIGRVRTAGTYLVVHDTTDVTVGGSSEREGMGVTSPAGQGFFAHIALAVLPGEERLPLGVLGLRRHVRPKGRARKTKRALAKDPERESLRWVEMLEQVHSEVGSDVINVMDREADIFGVLAKAQELRARYVIRAAQNRSTDEVGVYLRDAISELEPQLHRTIFVSKRGRGAPPNVRKVHPPRSGRRVEIVIAATSVTFKRPYGKEGPESLAVNVVRVWEPEPQADEPPIEWILLTTEPIDTADALAEVVDHYRSRWVIEDFFKALKQGCSLEKRQLESYEAMSKALAVFLPIAWTMLLMRSLPHAAPNEPATIVLSETQLLLLHAKLQLKARPETVEEALYAVARLGGHLRNNGRPGWQTLGRGFEELLIGEYYFRLVQSVGRPRC